MENRELKNKFETILKHKYGIKIEDSTTVEKYHALAETIISSIVEDWVNTTSKYGEGRVAHYMSLEYLLGSSLSNNLLNLNLKGEIKYFLEKEYNVQLKDIEEVEEDAGLGNGGLGRLAACFMESAATKELPLFGYGLRYSQGIFKQECVKGFQYEVGDNWLKNGDPWGIRKDSEKLVVNFAKQSVNAIPYDYPIVGYGTDNINTLRLWQAEAIEEFDFQKFNDFDYDGSLSEKNRAEDITRVLYPNDSKVEGLLLRFKQQYFFCSASIQDMVRKHSSRNRNILDFKKYNFIQLNDTHPVIAIAELIRIFVDEYKVEFNTSLEQAKEVFGYTNHTILKEALEQWPIDIVKEVCPRAYEIIEAINHNLVNDLEKLGYLKEKIEEMKIIEGGKVKMAYLGIYIAKSVNGVAKLHTNILKDSELRDWNNLYPKKFNNKTNGVTPRRWLQLCNPQLTQFIDERIGEDWKNNLELLAELKPFAEDNNSLEKLMEIKEQKKAELAKYIWENQKVEVSTKSIFHIQIKRFHEYKRQLLNALHIYYLYRKIKDNPQGDYYPQTFIFAGKAAPAYFRAKAIIKYINELANLINNDLEIGDRLKVVFLPNYRVSTAQLLFPSADVSQQISTAGKEASGTGNMKFMLNATPTMGTLDGANVEIFNEAGLENNYLFGATVEELRELTDSYNPLEIYKENRDIKNAVDSLVNQEIQDHNSFMFLDLYNSLVNSEWGKSDEYFVLKDFESYKDVQEKIVRDFQDRQKWSKKCLLNLASAGKFSSDRTILEYAQEIWEIEKRAYR